MINGITEQLEFIRDFQETHKESHVGGSIGLFLHGIDLKRDLRLSDIDITTPELMEEKFINNPDIQDRSDPSDFDKSYKKNLPSGHYLKMDIRISPEPSFEVINFEGYSYNVSKVRDIIFWKTKYATNGHRKHIDDLIVINGGERQKVTYTANTDDDLPF